MCQLIKNLINLKKVHQPINKVYFLILLACVYIGCSSPEYAKVVTEKMDGTRIGLTPEIIVSYSISEKGYRPDEYQDFYSNGNTHLIGNFSGDYVEPIRVGTWTQYHSNGTIFAKGSYEKNLKEKKWYYYHENGEKAGEGTYVNSKKNKKWKYYYSDGKKSQIQYFNMGSLNGEYNVWYSSGNKSTDGFYSNNMKDSLWKAYYDNKKELIYYEVIYDNSVIQNYSVYYENGGKLAEGGTFVYYNDQNGLYKLWYENGNKAYEESFRNGVKNGNAKYWDVNGKLIHNETLIEGVYTIESGNTKIIRTYNEDLSKLLKVDYSYILETDSNSVFKEQNLQVSATIDLTTRYKTGKWNAKYLSGTTAGIIEYTNGEKTGNWQIYYPSGKLVSKVKYVSDEEWTEAIDINGYKWVVSNPDERPYYQAVKCPIGKNIYVRNLNSSYNYCHKECRYLIQTSDMTDIEKDWKSLDNAMGNANSKFRASFSFNLDTPSPEHYDIDDPTLTIKLPFEIND